MLCWMLGSHLSRYSLWMLGSHLSRYGLKRLRSDPGEGRVKRLVRCGGVTQLTSRNA